MTDQDQLNAPRPPNDDEIIVYREWHERALAAVRERDELRAALDEAYPTTSRELFHGHHPMCGWTIEADPKACNCVVALHREAGRPS